MLLILYGIWQIPLAQGWSQVKGEKPVTWQTWNNQVSEDNTGESMKGLQKQPVQRYLGKVSKLREKRSDKVILYVMIPPQEFENDKEELTLAVRIGEDILCAKAFHKKFGTVTMGEDQCEIDIWKGSKYWCLTVTSENQWDNVNDRYELEIRRVQFPIMDEKTTIDLQ